MPTVKVDVVMKQNTVTRFLFCVFGMANANTRSEELNSLLGNIQTLRAAYSQTTIDPKLHDKQSVKGSVILSRPNQFRWETNHPYQQLLVSDGTRLWIYDIDLDQITVQPLQRNIKDTPALILIGDENDVSAHFHVNTSDQNYTEKTFELTPKGEDSLIKSAKLVFQGTIIKRMVFIDNLDQIIDLTFSEIKINDPLPQDLFRFVPPAGVDVIGDVDANPS